jgi:phosphoribosylformylglycinamidine synthase
MGAAGLTCSSSEMAAAGGVGIEVDLDKVPLREEGMEPWEIMMSESQERMLLCVEKGKEHKVLSIFHKWGLDAVVVGTVIKEQKMIITSKGKVIADAPTEELAKAPIYDMPFKESQHQTSNFKTKYDKDHNKQLIKLLNDPNIASKKSVYEQFDHMVQINTTVYPGGDAAVLRIKGKPWALAATTDCNGRYCQLNPYIGAQIAIAEAARNLVVTGAEPAAVTDCLNFGNPEKPDRFYQFKSCVEGIVDACKFMELPVVSGNVSFYNESPKGPILPTPTIGMVGIVKDVNRRCSVPYKDEGDLVVLLGHNREEEAGVPELDLDFESRVQKTCLEAIQSGIVKSAHDLSEGGLAVALAECSILSDKGAVINLSPNSPHLSVGNNSLLFGETQSRILLTIVPENIFSLSDFAMLYQVPCQIIGKVAGKTLTVMREKKKLINLPVSRLKDQYFGALPKLLEKQ